MHTGILVVLGTLASGLLARFARELATIDTQLLENEISPVFSPDFIGPKLT